MYHITVNVNHTERRKLFSETQTDVVSSNVAGDTVLRFRLQTLQFAAAVLVLVSESYCSRLRQRRTTFCQLSGVCCYNRSLLQHNVGIPLTTCNSRGPQTCTHMNKVPCAITWDFINAYTESKRAITTLGL